MKNYLKRLSIACIAAGTSLSTLSTHAVNYGEALQKSIYFYEAQQAGKLPEWNRVEWRGDSVLEDGSDNNVDLSGGWFDAGDHVKFGFPMAASATMLAWGVIENPEAYQQTGQMAHIKNNLRFVADYFMKAHVSPNELYGQVGSGSADHAWWGSPEVVHLTSRAASDRPSFKIDPSCPGSDLAGETAAALASIALVFADESNYANELLIHARQLYSFAKNYPGKYSDCITDVKAFYNSWSGYQDELVWSALWLHRATGEDQYLNAAIEDYANLGTEPQSATKSYRWTHAWDDKSYGSYVLMSTLTDDPQYRADAERWLDYWSTGYEGNRVRYTPGGLAQLDTWGATRYAANTSFIALIYSDYLARTQPNNPRSDVYYDFAVSQIEYIMGDNPNNIPYQIGIADNGPKNPHHRGAHGTWADSLQIPVQSRHLLVGALVGGPGSGDAYSDDRGDYIANEVATDYNAAFTGALARLYLDFGGNPIPESEFPAPESRDREFFVDAKVNASGPRFIEIGARVYNQSAWPATNGSALKFRYFVNLSAEIAKGYSADDVEVSTAYSQATSVSQLQAWGNPSDNIYYSEVDFSGVNVFPGGQSDYRKEVQLRLSLPSNSNAADWDNSADPSWDDYSSTAKVAPKIVLYNGNQRIWGTEPSAPCGEDSGINCLPTARPITARTVANTSVQFELDGSDSDGSIASYSLTQPQHGQVTRSAASVTYMPDEDFSGTDSFRYTAIDNLGAVSTPAEVTVTVDPAPVPSVDISSPSADTNFFINTEFPLHFILQNAHSVRVQLNGGQIATLITNSPITITTPSSSGDFLVELIAQDANGDDLAARTSVILRAVDPTVNTPPSARFSSSVSGLTVSVDASDSSDADGDMLSYEWLFDDVAKSGITTSHSFAEAGTFVVELIVSDGQAATRLSKEITVAESGGNAQCEFSVQNEWQDGYVANVRITNSGTDIIDGWSVNWNFPTGVSRQHGWGAEFTGTQNVSATAMPWNRRIAQGESIEFGMVVSKPAGSVSAIPLLSGEVCSD